MKCPRLIAGGVALWTSVQTAGAAVLLGEAEENLFASVISTGVGEATRDELAAGTRIGTNFFAPLALGALEAREFDPARALHHLGLALARLEDRPDHSEDPGSGRPHWHAIALLELSRALGAMNRREEQLAALDRFLALGYERFEGRPGISRGTWLTKLDTLRLLGQLDTAEAHLTARADPGRTISGAALRAISVETLRLRFLKDPNDAAPPHDLGRIISGGQLDPYEIDLLAAMLSYRGDANGSARHQRTLKAFSAPTLLPELHLASMHVAAGNWEEAIKEIGDAWLRTAGRRIEFRADQERFVEYHVALCLLAYGYPQEALEIALRLLDAPPRGSFSTMTFQPDQWRAACLLLAIEAERAQALIAGESSRTTSLIRIGTLANDAGRALRQMARIEQFRASISNCLLSSPAARDWTDYFNGRLLPPWLWPSLVRLAGPDVVARAAAQRPFPEVRERHYGNAITALIDHARGKDASPHARLALEEIPPHERLLRSAVEALVRRGGPDRPVGHFAPSWPMGRCILRLPRESGPPGSGWLAGPPLTDSQLNRLRGRMKTEKEWLP